VDVLLDGRLMVSREALHDLLAEKLELPAYYGRNLDALYDLLTERRDALVLVLIHVPELRCGLGRYADALFNTLKDAADANPSLSVKFLDNFSESEK